MRQAQCRARLGEEDADRLLADFITAHCKHDSVPVALVERWELARAAHRDEDARKLLVELEHHPGLPILHTVLSRMHRDLVEAVTVDPAHRRYGSPFPVGADAIVRDRGRAILEQAKRFAISPADPDLEGDLAIVTNLSGHPDWCLALLPPRSHTVGELLMSMGRYDEVFARFARDGRLARQSALASGTHDDEIIAAKGPDLFRVLLERGEFAACEPLATTADQRGALLVCSQRFEEAVRDLPADSQWRSEALFRLGRYQEAADAPDPGWKARALARLGRFDEATGVIEEFLTRSFIAVERRAAGQARESDAMLADIEQHSLFALSTDAAAFARHLMPAVLAVLDGREHDLRALLEPVLADRRWTAGQQVWYAGRFITGQIDEAGFREQPSRRLLEARLAFLRAVPADCRGGRAAAIALYREFLAVPLWKRHGYGIEESFSEMRLAALGAGH